jgi:hypothetical protein
MSTSRPYLHGHPGRRFTKPGQRTHQPPQLFLSSEHGTLTRQCGRHHRRLINSAESARCAPRPEHRGPWRASHEPDLPMGPRTRRAVTGKWWPKAVPRPIRKQQAPQSLLVDVAWDERSPERQRSPPRSGITARAMRCSPGSTWRLLSAAARVPTPCTQLATVARLGRGRGRWLGPARAATPSASAVNFYISYIAVPTTSSQKASDLGVSRQ